jgi:hypothetical protein
VAQQQRKPQPEPAPPPRRTAIPPPANDNAAWRRVLMAGAIALIAAAGLFAAKLAAWV